MKRFLLLAALLSTVLTANGQITIGPSDGLRAGDSISLYFIPDSLFGSLSMSPSVPGQTWNFSLPGWQRGYGGNDMVVLGRQSLPDDSAFADASLALLEVHVMPEFGTRDETYTYLGVTDDRLVELGSRVRFDVQQGTPRREYTIVERNEGYGQPLPMRFGDHWTNSFRTVLLRTPADTTLPDAPRLASISHVRAVSDVDGWGTVATPHGAFNALRVHTTRVSADSLFDEHGGFTTILADTLETYDWYSRTTGAYLPVVSVEVAQGAVASVQIMRYTQKNALVASADDEDAPSLYLGDGTPNPASTRMSIPFAVRGRSHVTMAIYDMLGNEVRKPLAEALLEEEGSVEVDLSDLPQGSYICRLEADGESVSRPILVRR
jgi:hypothetical protein